MVQSDPADHKDVILEVRSGRGRRRGGALGRRPLPHAHALRRTARLQGRGARGEPERRRRVQGGHVRDQGRRRVLRLQVGGRRAPRAARAGDRVAGPHPHVDGDGRGDAGGRGGRGRHRPERPEDRRLPLDRPRRPVGEHDRLRGAHHARADRRRRLDAGREVAAPEQGEGDARPARAPLRARARASSAPSSTRRAARRSAPASAARRSARTTSPRTGSPTTGSS